ncbi:hypothetical protein ZWY2020_020927 [Hordeum vulgare]|nr:hypothetical protein ZWY2020_020927 [Hordeum vulgare]
MVQLELTAQLGPHVEDENDSRRRLDRLAESSIVEEGIIGPACFGTHILNESFPTGFTLPRDTTNYKGSAKPEDWLVGYTTAAGIARGKKRVAVRYVPLMLLVSA